MKKAKYLAFCLLILSYLAITLSAQPEIKLPRGLAKEYKQFLENQIVLEDKEFLDQLSQALIGLSKTNQETLNLIKATAPPGKKYYRKISKNIQLAAKRTNYSLFGLKRPVGILNSFIQEFFSENTTLQENLYSLTLDYRTAQDLNIYIGDELKNNIFAEGIYTYYQRCADFFEANYGENFSELLEHNISFYSYLARLAHGHKIKELKAVAPSYIEQIETAQELIQTEVVNKIELANRNWAKKVIINSLAILKKQLDLNKEFNLALIKALKDVPTPTRPKLPDLIVSSVEIVMPDQVKKGTKIKVIAEVKNTGELNADRSRVLLIFPNQRQRGRPVPKLKPNQNAKVTWIYKVRKKGKHEFNLMANYDQRAWEANYDNNTAARTLIIPRCHPD